MSEAGAQPVEQSHRRGALARVASVVGLFFLSPICAEYLSGYDEGIESLPAMLAGLLVLGPLYGTVAVLIREVSRRTGRGWPTILLLGAAFGLIQAGLIDQTLFDPPYAGDSTVIPGLGFSAEHLLIFVGGHVIWSFAAPIAVVEACVPRRADRPWLGRVGMTVMVVLYLGAVAVFVNEFLVDGQLNAAPAQLGGTAVVVAALVVAAFAVPRRSTPSPGRVPPVWLVGCVALVVLAMENVVSTWAGVAVGVVALALFGGHLLHWSRRAGWMRSHVLAVAGAALVVRAVVAFTIDPLGDPDYASKYVSNTVILLGVIALLAWAWRRTRRAETNVGPKAAPQPTT